MQYAHHHHPNQWGECHLEQKTLEGQELTGGLQSFTSDAHLLGGHELAVWPVEATECFVGAF